MRFVCFSEHSANLFQRQKMDMIEKQQVIICKRECRQIMSTCSIDPPFYYLQWGGSFFLLFLLLHQSRLLERLTFLLRRLSNRGGSDPQALPPLFFLLLNFSDGCRVLLCNF